MQWYPVNSNRLTPPPAGLVDWLLDPGSFMQRLRHAGVNDAKVAVLSQRWEVPQTDELYMLNIGPRQYALVREVLIHSRQDKWMFARTVIPKSTLTGREQLLGRLKNRALGTLLFNHPQVTRSEFMFSHIDKYSHWFKAINAVAKLSATAYWARRSMFHIKHKSLLLTEVFFPDLMEL